MAELPTVTSFEAAVRYVATKTSPRRSRGPDPERHVSAIRKYLDAGFDHVVLLNAEPDQEGFLGFFQAELKPRLASL